MTDREPQTGETALREALATTMRVMLGGHPGVTVGPRDPDVDRAWSDVLAGALREQGYTVTPLATAQEPDTRESRDLTAISHDRTWASGYAAGRAAALREEPDTRPASVAGLGAAWAEAEAALPEGCILVSRWDPGVYRAVWSGDGGLGRDHEDADSPAGALHALAQRLREHSDPDAAGEWDR